MHFLNLFSLSCNFSGINSNDTFKILIEIGIKKIVKYSCDRTCDVLSASIMRFGAVI